MVNNTINVGDVMREASNLNVSQKAVDSMRGWIKSWIEHCMACMDEKATKERRLTILERDVENHINFTKVGLFPTEV